MGGLKFEVGLKESPVVLIKQLVAEFLGTAILNFFGCGSCSQISGNIGIAVAFGLAVFISIMIIGPTSGGHINPAVSIGLIFIGGISVVKAPLYIVSQCLGAVVGTGLLKLLLPSITSSTILPLGLGHTDLSLKTTQFQGMGIECMLGFILLLTVCSACDEVNSGNKPVSALGIGLAVTVGHLGALSYTGSSMNPARTFGTAVITSSFTNHWVYWVGPILGGIIAVLIYTFVLGGGGKSDNE